MHQSAMYYGGMFFKAYCHNHMNKKLVIAEIGSQNVNGSLRDIAPEGSDYIGMDFVTGNGVDIIIDDPYRLPLDDNSVDVVVSSSCFEHSEFFWLVLLEALRVLKKDGVLYLNAPSNGFVHRWPVDCWRFYPDSGHAMVNWANRNGHNALLLESFIGQKSEGEVASGGAWNDFVAVILKDASFSSNFEERIIDSISDFSNGYSSKVTGVINDSAENPDSTALIAQSERIKNLVDEVNSIKQLINAKDLMIKDVMENNNIFIENIKFFESDSVRLEDERLNLNLSLDARDVIIKEMLEEKNTLLENIKCLKDEKSRLENEKLELEDEKSKLEDEKSRLYLSLSELNIVNSDLHNIADSYRVYIDEIKQSTSWKISSPVRLFGRKYNKVISMIKFIISKLILEPKRKFIKLYNASFYALRYYGSYKTLIKKVVNIYNREGLKGIKNRANTLLLRNTSHNAKEIDSDNVVNHSDNSGFSNGYNYDIPSDNIGYEPLVSIIVPNYNHEKYLRERLDSIYSQTYKNIEVILLDDKSTDNSKIVLEEYAERYKENTRIFVNEENSGGVFFQWKKGFSLARGDLIWIAESDDYCSSNFLEENVKKFRNEAVMLSFCRTVFVSGDDKKEIWSSDEYLNGLDLKNLDKDFIKSAHYLVNHSWGIGNLVANVSSALFRHPGDLQILDDKQWFSMKICGDWVFYLHLIRGGLVAYTPNSTNYYRQHEKNTSTSNQSKPIYYQEYEAVAKQIVSLYKVNDGVLPRLEKEVQKQWSIFNSEESFDVLSEYFNIKRVRSAATQRKPNLLMSTYALAAGGGETFPILLANIMQKNGYAVTLFNWFDAPTEIGVRKMLNKNIPLLQNINREQLGVIATDLGIEVTHSHHACVDMSLAALLLENKEIARVISMHGMYEMIPEKERKHCLGLMERSIHKVVYTAQKNLIPFSVDFQNKLGFVKVNNALPKLDINPVDMSSLGVEEDDFVICLVSRAIPEKGWAEAIDAVNIANGTSERKIHLLLIGEGECYESLSKSKASSTIHFLGFRSNIRDYFSASDIGLLPSRFKGESFPLVLIDCLLAGRPIIASDVGEIADMIKSSHGDAGVLFSLDNWKIPVEELASLLVDLSSVDSKKYNLLKNNVPHAASKFSEEKLFEAYDGIYTSTISHVSYIS
ncbi:MULTISPECIES: glycosyltransferase [Dickeya]|uniref:Chromosome segregation ATPases-like protein n=1 Tax=Dickeya aquatica TaxID=1401087 RepID=A0A375A6U2_9GAMM|nr:MULTISPECIES: glycosyltransferase [Dickeya]SLM61832.1 Chromosome segregation ATPases-like protein [Dickeya aquatica]